MSMQGERKGARKHWLAEDIFPDLRDVAQDSGDAADDEQGILMMFKYLAARQRAGKA